MKQNGCLQEGCFLCTNCLPEWQKVIEVSREIVHFNKAQDLFKEGEAIRGVYFILSGAVKIHQSWGNGRQLILRFATRGDVVGHRGLGVARHFPVSATALQDGSACFVTTQFLETTAKTNPGFVFALISLYADELQMAEKRIRDLAVLNASERLADSLLSMRDKFGENAEGFIQVPVNRQDLAFYAGTTYETVFRILTQWASQGLVQCSGKHIRIPEPDRVRQLISL
ncbi:MAG TPA: Crp/Fnr family transcriptional regulator [Puia sp.]|nr:Crp/Fnr family transcriptional regulator [Puia sp.]